MLVSCLCVCHAKPDLAQEAIDSILQQTYLHWQAVIVDSGVLYDAGYYDRFAWRRDPRVRLLRSPETEVERRSKAMAPWCFNLCLRRGLVTGDLVMYLADDDLLYRRAFATFVAYAEQHPEAQAMYASQDLAVIYPNGWRALVGERRATVPGGRVCGGRPMDCHVDYLQFCHRRDVLRLFPDAEYWPEDKATEAHADGIFMERIGEKVPIHPLDMKVSQNRRTLLSTYVPVQGSALLDCLTQGAPLSPVPSQEETPSTATTARRNPEARPLVTVSIRLRALPTAWPDVLASVAAQSYTRVEVLVVADGPDDMFAHNTLVALQRRYPHFGFPEAHARAGRDHGLWAAQGSYFIPMDETILASPDMVERLVNGIRARGVSALACYSVALAHDERKSATETSAPRLLASCKNLASSGIFDVAHFREVGGYGGEQPLGQDWLGFAKLVNAGYPVAVLPEHLFSTWLPMPDRPAPQAPLPGGAPVLRSFFALDRHLAAERTAFATAQADLQRHLQQLRADNGRLVARNRALEARTAAFRYRLADRLFGWCARIPLATPCLRWLLRAPAGERAASSLQEVSTGPAS